jgi:catechol 2,3-dioxygenase-like lactoylglutathione lyase family enzyme
MIKTVNHIGATVKDLVAAVAFFRDILGLKSIWNEYVFQGEIIEKITGLAGAHVRVVKIDIANIIIELVQYLSPPGGEFRLKTNDVGCTHISFEVDSIDEMYESLCRKGVKFMSEPVMISSAENPMRGWKSVYFRGPEHITLELTQRPN